jgi:hypothetical protein
MPLLGRGCPAYPVNTIVYIHKESLRAIVYIAEDNFAVTVKPQCVWLVVKLIEDQFSHLDGQHSAT